MKVNNWNYYKLMIAASWCFICTVVYTEIYVHTKNTFQYCHLKNKILSFYTVHILCLFYGVFI